MSPCTRGRGFAPLFLALLLPGLAPAPADAERAGDAVSPPAARPAAVYVCPMHPEIRRPEPGRCPLCGMALVRREEAEPRAATPAIVLDGRMIQALAVRTEAVRRRPLAARVRAPARVGLAEDRIVHLHTRAEGWVERLAVPAVGTRVAAGELLFELYAPALVAAQEDYLLALRQSGKGSRAERAAAERLLRLGMEEALIDRIAAAGSSLRAVPVRAPRAGVVTALGLRQGMFLDVASVAMEIAALDELWIEVELTAEELGILGDGRLEARFRHPGRPGRRWRASDPERLPMLAEATRNHRLRYRLPNPRGLLAPGELLEAELRGEAAERLAVPVEAVLRLPEGARVVLAEGSGRFRPVPVRLGGRYGRFLEIREGLTEGQAVVVNAQFLLDAEAALRAGLERLGGDGGHEH
ncbi:MAG: efflux RND transporter periplasmic adaptor subunit [Xanthomonadales bacterium]|nr:efflux RND transporter periplasmic adaptor subunit [Xanthomonadales bacterium]